MSKEIEDKIDTIPVLRHVVKPFKRVKLGFLQGMSLYELLEIYLLGVAEGAVTYRAAAIAFSFFMALFPFALFVLNLVPFIPLEGFQNDFMKFVEESVPPNTYSAIFNILNDIMNNSHSGLLSSGFLLSIFVMANGVNSVLGGFETSHHVLVKRGFVRQYLVALAISLLLSVILIVTVSTIVVFEVFIQMTKIQDVLSDNIPILVWGRYVFVMLMILVTSSTLLKFGTKHTGKRSFISVGSVFTTILIIISSYFFGIWVVKFAKYNQLYGSIGTLLILMFYIWLNCVILLLGFELNAAINRIKRKNLFTQ
ncbi:MAG: YihY/virulence factor BrkB family protein [Flavobacterium sp.]|nr:MAG: YihY/virulence factor BrkB family protein [Flavobacterium sp.]